MQDSKVIISTCRYRKCREALYFKEFEIQCFCVLTGVNGLMLFLIVFRVKKLYLVKKYHNILFHVISFIGEIRNRIKIEPIYK